MSDVKSSISQAQSYQEMGRFWDTHDVTEFWDRTAPAEFEVDIQAEITYYPLETSLAIRLTDARAADAAFRPRPCSIFGCRNNWWLRRLDGGLGNRRAGVMAARPVFTWQPGRPGDGVAAKEDVFHKIAYGINGRKSHHTQGIIQE